jgi:peptide chain release factor 1
MFDRLERAQARFREVQDLLSDPDTVRDQKKYRELSREYAHLGELVEAHNLFKKGQSDLAGARELAQSAGDPEMKEMAREEVRELEARLLELDKNLKLLLVPPDPLDGKDIIMEIRAGTGGEEAALFASDLYRMYCRYAERKKWKIELLSASETEMGGFKEIVFSMSGKSVYGDLRYESGVHRVQRIPVTESGGRIHTSAITVAVLPEAEESDIEIRTEDLRVDVYRSSGAGGQHVNTTDSAVRITHLPTGVVVACQDERSQIKNRAKAMRVLRARLLEAEDARLKDDRDAARKNQVGSGDRSERIRTYNFPQNRLTDHRVNLTLYKLDQVMEGDVGDVFETLKLSAREEAMKED